MNGNAVKHFHVGKTGRQFVAEAAKVSEAAPKRPNSGESGYRNPAQRSMNGRMNSWPLVVALLLCAASSVDAGWPYAHRQRSCNQRCLPAYGYQQDNARARAEVLVLADEPVPANVADNRGNREPTIKKRFHVPVSGLEADAVRLEGIGLVLLSTGEAIFTGTLDHDGGPNGSLRGNLAVIHVRAYTGVARQTSVQDAPCVWESTHRVWVRRGQPRPVKFGTGGTTASSLRRFFPEITHLQLELETIHDR